MNESTFSATQIPMRYIKIFFRRKWLLAIPLVIGLVGGIIAGAVLPKEYQSSSVVLIQEEKTINPLIKGLAVSTDVVSRMRTIKEQILGWNSLVQLVKRLNLDKDVKSQLEYEQLVMGLRDKIDVRMKGPNLIKISYASSEPVEAQKIVKTVNDIFIEENMKSENLESSVAISFIKDQIKVYRRKIKEAEIADMKDKLKNLLIDSTEAHPLVIDYRRKIAELEKEVNEDFDVDNAKPIAVTNPSYNNLIQQQVDAAAQQAEGAPASESGMLPLDEVNPSHTTASANLYSLLLLDKLDAVAARDAKVNENIYNMLLQRLETAKITQRLEASKQGTRYMVLDPPRLPLKPFKPNKILVMLMGLFLGGACGVGLVLLFEFADQSLLGIDEAKDFLELPLLGGISKILTEDDIAAARSRNRFRTATFVIASIMLIVLSSLYSLFQKP